VIYQGSAIFGVYVQQWHTDELYSIILEHEGCKASAPIDESSGGIANLGEMAAEASVALSPLSAPFTPARSTSETSTPRGARI
jgi:hypothetical protein